MIAFGLFSEPTTAPYRTTNGISFDLRGGDVVQPLDVIPMTTPDGKSKWYFPPYFQHWLRFYLSFPMLPWLTVKIGRFGMYAGAKCFGVEPSEDGVIDGEGGNESYLGWFAKPMDVFPGSRCIMLFTMRFTSRLNG